MTALRVIGFMLAFLCGRQPALAICIAGVGDTPDCRYIAVCTKGGVSQASCSCSYKLAQEIYPKEQLGAFTDVFEAYSHDDEGGAKVILSRHGLGVIEFTNRLNSVMSAASVKCGR